ncbi:MAG: tape measure protein [Burkholderiales bacterium]|nr:tape measure protein [Burkholderiales bacterium]
MSRPLEAKLRISAEVQQALTSLRSVQQELKGLDKQADAAGSRAQGLAGTLSGLRGALAGLAGVATLQVMAREIVGARIEAERLQAVLKLSTDGPQQAAEDLEWLKKTLNDLGLRLDTAGMAYAKFAVAAKGTALEGEAAKQVFEQVARASAVMGLSAEDTSGVLLAMTQMLSKGVVSSEELRGQMGERLPNAFQLSAEGMGVTTEEFNKMLARGEVMASDLLPRLATVWLKSLGQAPEEAAKGAQGEINRFHNALLELKQTLGDAGIADGLVAALADVNKGLAAVTQRLKDARQEGEGFFGTVVALYNNRQKSIDKMVADLQQPKTAADAAKQRKELEADTSTWSWQSVVARQKRIAELRQIEQRLQAEATKAAEDAKAKAATPIKADEAKLQKERERSARSALKDLLDKAKTEREKIAEERANFLAGAGKHLSSAELAQAEAAFAKRMQGAGGVAPTRQAQIRAAYDAELDLLRDAIEREQQVNEQRFQDGLTELGDYLATRGRLQRQAAEADLKRLEQERAAAAAGLAQARGLAASGDPQEAARGQEAVLRATDRLAQVEAEIAMRKRDQVDAQRALLRDAEQINRERTRTLAELDDQVKAARGEQLSPAELRAQVEREFADTARRIGNDEEGQARLGQLIDLEAARRQFDQLRALWQRTTQDMATAEAAVRQQQEAGALTASQAEQQLLALRREQVPALDAILARMRELAATPDQQSAVRQLEVELGGLRQARTELEEAARSSATAEFTQGLTDIATGAKTAKDALTDMVGGFAKAMLNVINQRLGKQLVDSLMGDGTAGGGSGWLGAFVSAVGSLFHTGGVVGTGAGTRRTLPAHTWALAPRYHGGGIAGLAPGEVPAVLMAGEEVLTEDNPRHIKNAGRSVGGLSVVNNVQISGAQGDDAQAAEAARSLTDTINASIDRWAVRESRPGGLLAGRR